MRRSHLRTDAATLCLLLAGCLAAAPAQARPPVDGELTGVVGYRHRIALPPDAVLVVQLAEVGRDDVATRVLASDTVRAAGRQVPLPFRLRYDDTAIDPAGRYALRARLLDGRGRALWRTATAHPVLTAGAPADSVSVTLERTAAAPADPPITGPTYVFVCDAADTSFTLTARVDQQRLALWLPLRFGRPYMVLEQTRAASGARYQRDDVVLWNKGASARLEVGDQVFADCRHDRRASEWAHAKLDGVDFRAIGRESEWHLEIRHAGPIIFTRGDGIVIVELPTPEPVVDVEQRRTVYRVVTGAHDLTVTLEPGPCTVSGQSFSSAVTVKLDGDSYAGCGRPLH